jgi:hypothetical protein
MKTAQFTAALAALVVLASCGYRTRPVATITATGQQITAAQVDSILAAHTARITTRIDSATAATVRAAHSQAARIAASRTDAENAATAATIAAEEPRHTASPDTGETYTTRDGRTYQVQVGPKGGRFYITDSGAKRYIK